MHRPQKIADLLSSTSALAKRDVLLISGALICGLLLHNYLQILGLDHVLYWAGTQLFFSATNPYSTEEIALILSRDIATVPGIWNPPWSFVLFSPIFSLPLDIVEVVLCALNLYLLLQITNTFRELTKPLSLETHQHVWGLAFAFLGSIAWLMSIFFGQISIILTYITLAAYKAFLNGKPHRALLLLVLLSVKPHFAFLVSAFLIVSILCDYGPRAFVRPVLVFGVLNLISYCINPTAYLFWFSGQALPTQWYGATLSSLAKQYLFEGQAKLVYSLAPIAFAIVGVLLAFPLLQKKCSKNARTRVDAVTLSYLIALSLIFAPYGFVFDQVPLIFVLYTMGVLAAKHEGRLLLVGLLSGVFVVAYGPLLFEVEFLQEYYAVYPLLILGMWTFVLRRSLGLRIGCF